MKITSGEKTRWIWCAIALLLCAALGAARAEGAVIAETTEGFSLIFDGFAWEGGALRVSYSAVVPSDGATYLLLFSAPRLQAGRERTVMLAGSGDSESRLRTLGGGRPTRIQGTLTFENLDPSLQERTDVLVSMFGIYLRALRPVDEMDIGGLGENLSAEALARSGNAAITAQRDAGIVLDAAVFADNAVDALAETRFEMQGYAVEIQRFSANLQRAECAFRVIPEGGAWLARSYALLRADGGPLAYEGSLTASAALAAPEGGDVLEFCCLAEGDVGLNGGEGVLLVPRDADGNYLMDEAIALTPVR